MGYGSTIAFFTIQKYSKGATNFEKNRYEIVATLHHFYKYFKFVLILEWL